MRVRLVVSVAILVSLAACSGSGDQPAGVTADEAQQLNEAAAMLDANSVDLNRIDSGDRADDRNER